MAEVGGDAFGIDGGGQRKRAGKLSVPAFDLMVLLTGDTRVAAALQGDAPVVHFDADLLARQAR